jgi:hypothetical protein
MPRRNASPPSAIRNPRSEEGRFIEIANWKKAQPGMPDKDAQWMKLYKSLGDCHQFLVLSERSQMLVIALWLYATESGRYVFPADPKWLRQHIKLLKHDPDLRPLLEAKDEYGEPAPFIRIVDKKGIYNVRNRHSKKEKEKESKTKSKTEPLRAPEKKRERKKRACARTESRQQQREPEPDQRDRPSTEAGREQPQQPAQPANPAKSEAGGPAVPSRALTGPTMAPKALRPVCHYEPQPIGRIIASFMHWKDADAVAFGYEVFAALGLYTRGDPESQWGKSERGAFTKWLHGHSHRIAARLHGLHVAQNMGKYCKGLRKPGAAWLAAVNGMSRAPPATKTA